jgi:hypothetical protein
MKKFIHAASAFSLVAALALAAPSGPVKRIVQETPGVPYTSNGAYQDAAATFTQVLSTDFEAPDWQDGFSVCGDQFGFGVTCFYPVTNSCLFKNHAANQNCCPEDEHNPLLGDPNPYTGWSMSPSGRHCRIPAITSIHPFGGSLQHMRFEYDPLGGLPGGGCTAGAFGNSGFGSTCRTRAITAQVSVPDISHAVWSMEIAWSNTLGSSMVQFVGQDTSVGSINLIGYIYWYYLGGIYIYNLNTGTFGFGGYWSSTIPDYANFTGDYNPCDDTVTYSYGGGIVQVEQFGFHPPYGDGPDDIRPPVPDTTFYTQDHFPSITDIDNHFVTYTPCTDACCDGVSGLCTDDSNAVDCSGPSKHYYPNVTCSQLGTSPIYPPRCDKDTAACCDRTPTFDGDSDGVKTDNVLLSACSGAQQTWNKGTSVNGADGKCNLGRGTCSTGFCSYGHGKIGGPCTVSTDCDVAGFCYSGLCTLSPPIGTCRYPSLGYCALTGTCSISGTECANCPTGPFCPLGAGEVCVVPSRACNVVPSGADCPYCDGCPAFATVACNVDADCPAPFPLMPAGTCVANALTGCNVDTDCPAGNTCTIQAINKGGDLCTSNADCVTPAAGTCFEDTGLCCDVSPLAGGPEPEGVCTDGIDIGGCQGPQLVWTKLGVCGVDPCLERTGSCCDEAQAGGVCTDEYRGDCPDGFFQHWTKSGDCGTETCDAYGACCNTLDGTCEEHMLESACQGAQRVWSLGTRCADSGCAAVFGACCDTDPFGGCEQTILADCQGDKLQWHKLEACTLQNCVHNSIPTVSEWGLVVLTLLLLTGAKVYFGRRQAVA